ncbi:MAG: MATE family efflux transporter [Chloroflexi bacterium]|nr:MATE family efflux transporter [Chloroflexota bacterium]
MEVGGGLRTRRPGFEKDWTKGSIIRNLLSLSWPVMVGNSVNMMGPTIDMIWVGKLGPTAIAAVGVSGMAVMIMQSLMMGLFGGLRAIVARSIGEGNPDAANHAAQQAFVMSTVFSLLIAVIGIFFAEPILALMGVAPEVISEGAAYMRIQFVGMITMSLRFMTEGTMQASGDVTTPMKIAVAFRIFHVVLSPVLIFGLWFFPPLGVRGAAITNVFSQGLGTALGLWFLMSGRTRLRLSFRNFYIDPGMIWRLVKIGIPTSIMGIQRNFGQVLLIRLVASFGTLAMAAHTLGQRVDMLIFMPGGGVGMAAGVLAGQNLGANQPERAAKSGWLGVLLTEAFMVICSLAILLWAEPIVRVFNSQPDLVEIASRFLRIAAVGYMVMGFPNVLMQCISGVGDTVPPMIWSMVTLWLVLLPLAYFLPNVANLGVYGIRWAFVAEIAAGTLGYTAYFWLGRWKRKKV